MVVYTAEPPIANANPQARAISLGVEFKVTQPGLYFVGPKFWARPITFNSESLVGALYDPLAAASDPPLVTCRPPFKEGPGASSVLDVTYSPDKAFDGNLGTNWTSTAAPTVELPQWLLMGFDYPRRVTSYQMWPYTSGAFFSESPKDWRLQGSHTAVNGTWVTVDQRSNVTWADLGPKTFTVAVPRYYRHYRVLVTANNGRAEYMAIRELQFSDSSGVIPLNLMGTTYRWNPFFTPTTPYLLTPEQRYKAVVYFPKWWPGANGSWPTADLVSGPLTVFGRANTAPDNNTYSYDEYPRNPLTSGGTNYMLTLNVTDDPAALEDPHWSAWIGGLEVPLNLEGVKSASGVTNGVLRPHLF